jgi:starch-binding outer membrane protein, SusD/RagB family
MNIRTLIGRARIGLPALLTALAIAATGCKDALEVQNEQDILDPNLDSPDAIAPLITGVAGDFAVAYGNAVDIVGLFGGELTHTGSFPSWREVEGGYARRPSTEGDNMYNQIERAIWVADTAAVRIAKVVADPTKSPEVAAVTIYGAFAHFLLADNYCVGTIKSGAAISDDSLYKRAEALFTSALTIATAANRDSLRLRALAGRARARLMLKNYSGARDDATLIPSTFRFNAIYSSNSSRENNSVATLTTTLIRREAGVNPRFYTTPVYTTDPRTPFRNKGDTAKGPDPIRQFVEQLKYPQRDTPIAMSSWQEARLIEAEAENQLGNSTRAVTLINQVRAAANLPAYSGAVTQAAVLTQIRYERSAELWLQAQSVVDERRFADSYLAAPHDKCFDIGQREWDSNPLSHTTVAP